MTKDKMLEGEWYLVQVPYNTKSMNVLPFYEAITGQALFYMVDKQSWVIQRQDGTKFLTHESNIICEREERFELEDKEKSKDTPFADFFVPFFLGAVICLGFIKLVDQFTK